MYVHVFSMYSLVGQVEPPDAKKALAFPEYSRVEVNNTQTSRAGIIRRAGIKYLDTQTQTQIQIQIPSVPEAPVFFRCQSKYSIHPSV